MRLLLLSLLLALTATPAFGQEPQQEWTMQGEPFPLYRSTLSNGLRVWCQPRLDSESVATLLVLRAGARYETLADSGISHFLEHMLFTGTDRWSEEEIKDVITRRGGRWNGWTGFERTTYFAHVASGDLDVALDWLAELVFRATVPADKVDKERQVIFQERWGRYGWLINTLDALGFGYELDRDIQRALFPGSSLGLRIAGEDASLEGVDRSALLDYYQAHYTLDNAVLIVVGNVEPSQVQGQVAEYFGGVDRAGRPAPPETPALPAGGPHQVVVRGPMPTDQVRLMTGARTVGRAHSDRWALDVLAEVLDKSLSEEIRYQRGLVYGLSAWGVYYDDAGYFYVNTTSDKGDREAILQVIDEHLERVRESQVSPDAVAEAKVALQGRWALSMEDNVQRAIWLAQWTSLVADGETVPDYPALVGSVTAEDLSQVVASYFTPERSYTGLHQPVVTVASGVRIAGAAVALGLGLWGVRRLRRRRKLTQD